MNSDALILRQNDNPPLTNKGAQITSDEFDANFIKVYNDLRALFASSFVPAYSSGTEYNNSTNQYVSHNGRVWEFIAGSPSTGVTPVEGATWTEIAPSKLVHIQDRDTKLAEHTANEVTAADIRAKLDEGASNTLETSNLVLTDAARDIELNGNLNTDYLEINEGTNRLFSIHGDGSHEMDTLDSVNGFKVYTTGKSIAPNNYIRLADVGGFLNLTLNATHGGTNRAYLDLNANNESFIRGNNRIRFVQLGGGSNAIMQFDFTGDRILIDAPKTQINFGGKHQFRMGGNDESDQIAFSSPDGINDFLAVSAHGNVIAGKSAPATTSTDGFLYIPEMSGPPTGTPDSKTGYVPLVADGTNNKIYAYLSGAWTALN